MCNELLDNLNICKEMSIIVISVYSNMLSSLNKDSVCAINMEKISLCGQFTGYTL